MEFRTKIQIPISPFFINHSDRILMLGSCFTENIGHRLSYFGFNVHCNPFGILYNPISIFNVIKRIAHEEYFTENDLYRHQDLFVSFEHHGKFSNTQVNVVLDAINNEIKLARQQLKGAKWLILTLGSSSVYRHIKQDKIVANCHKIPNIEFEKNVLTIDAIKSAFNSIQHLVKDINIVFTVSPVRHWRDGAIENLRSKSILIECIHQLISENRNCFYFPSYEIMMDELRDYRFYAEDMLHPNEVAIKYIWKQFSSVFFEHQTHEINKEIEKGRLLFQHRVKHENSIENERLKEQKNSFIQTFQHKYPAITIKF
ncbi:MAG TPA: GSCFA domain-containing protein [Chitinophagales bacterium]|nr:GSCFA domain-containing protein [Chitinophagales bacterium]MBP6154676.1 GSCFA domain-containing protein [Chitinophagales bacterium]HQV77481.1 GSCFA domain-containing protein [Chitinophagales bacterium]HQW78543.1 GSCFA domain-containing protein [Chitinophagales bacterium]HRB67520.1 GSCFA domain-containing protein [Chitinophagales bacterium]